MALTQLSNIIEPTVWADTPAVDSPEKTAFYESGIITRSALLDELANAAGKTAELPFWKDLDETSAPNLSDDTENEGGTGNITQGEMITRKLFLNKGWKSADLVNEMAMGAKAPDAIRARTETYWKRQFQRYMIGAANGVLADNVANDGGDMVHDVALEAGLSATAANLFSRSNFSSSAFTLGDAFESTSAMAVHSTVYKRMVDNDDIDFIPDSAGRLTIPTFMGRRVIMDDSMPVVAGATNGFKYTSALFGEGAFGWGEGTPTVPVEIERKAGQGNGGGTEVLWTRKTHIIHPFGYQFTSTTVAGKTPSLAEMALAANWDRVVERKNVPVTFLITNG